MAIARAEDRRPRSTYFVLAVATGLSVAGIYLNQTLLGRFAEVFRAPPASVGLLATLTQIGYAIGIFFLVPMGDIANKKTLAVTKLAALSTALFAVGSASDLTQVFAGSLAIGIFASVAQDFVPIAAEIAPPAERGKVVGIVMSGLLVGILASRTVSGWIETNFGWSWVFRSFGALIAASIGVVVLLIPSVPPSRPASYRALMSKLVRLPKRERPLRIAMLTHGLVGLAFSAFWTNLSFHLSEPRFGFTTLQIGLFGLAGAAGALAAPIAGKLSDARGPIRIARIGISLVIVSFAAMLVFPNSVTALAIGAIVFDAGAQMSLISHQSIIYSLDPTSRSSLNAVFVTGMFASFAIGSALSTAFYGRGGWPAVLALGLAAGVSALGASRMARPERLS